MSDLSCCGSCRLEHLGPLPMLGRRQGRSPWQSMQCCHGQLRVRSSDPTDSRRHCGARVGRTRLRIREPVGLSSFRLPPTRFRGSKQCSGTSNAADQRVLASTNRDDCWMAKTRDANGNLQPDPVRFPSGMANLSAYVHSKGLKLGIYEASGGGTCCGFPGTDGPTHAVADVDQFSAWNIDLLKWDGCGPGAGGDYNKSYTAMYEALTRPHIRPMVYSCSWPAYINIPGTPPSQTDGGCVGAVH